MSAWDNETLEQWAIRTIVGLKGTTQPLGKLETVPAHFQIFQKSLLFTATNIRNPGHQEPLKWVAFLMLMYSLAFFFFFFFK